jgi:hypothetical protein
MGRQTAKPAPRPWRKRRKQHGADHSPGGAGFLKPTPSQPRSARCRDGRCMASRVTHPCSGFRGGCFLLASNLYGALRASPSLTTTIRVTDTDTGSLAGNDSSTAWSIAFSVGGVSAITDPVGVTASRGADAASRTLWAVGNGDFAVSSFIGMAFENGNILGNTAIPMPSKGRRPRDGHGCSTQERAYGCMRDRPQRGTVLDRIIPFAAPSNSST